MMPTEMASLLPSENSILLVSCRDRKGLVALITATLAQHNLNIIENGEFVDRESATFFMRSTFEGAYDEPALLSGLRRDLPDGAAVRLARQPRRPLVIMVTRETHCLGDLLIRCFSGDLNADIRAVIGNHDSLSDLTRRFDIPFHHVPHDSLSREEHEAKIIALLRSIGPDYIVLAKYMRILSPEFVRSFPGRLINIHHSFLPAFVGANPYRQAYDRGVKIIGATAHFVNDQLDQGPIIEQSVTPVTHSHDPKDMSRAGRDVEKVVLAKALRLALDERIFVHRNRTIIFE